MAKKIKLASLFLGVALLTGVSATSAFAGGGKCGAEHQMQSGGKCGGDSGSKTTTPKDKEAKEDMGSKSQKDMTSKCGAGKCGGGGKCGSK